MLVDYDTLIVPGIGNSGPEHWQSIWEQNDHRCRRIIQNDWDHPVLSVWMEKLDVEVARLRRSAIIVAHSLGCLLVAHWATVSLHTKRIQGALLVAVPDPASPSFPQTAVGFNNIPTSRIPFQSTLVASNTDPYSKLSFAQTCAENWGSKLICIGDAGHINASSGLGEWRFGHDLLGSLRATISVSTLWNAS